MGFFNTKRIGKKGGLISPKDYVQRTEVTAGAGYLLMFQFDLQSVEDAYMQGYRFINLLDFKGTVRNQTFLADSTVVLKATWDDDGNEADENFTLFEGDAPGSCEVWAPRSQSPFLIEIARISENYDRYLSTIEMSLSPTGAQCDGVRRISATILIPHIVKLN